MTSDLDNTAKSAGDRVRTRAYHRDFWPSIVGYVTVLTAVLIWGGLDGGSPSRFLWALLPVVPALWTVRAVLRHVRRIDDYQQLLLLHGLAVGFAIAMIASLTVGFPGYRRPPDAGRGLGHLQRRHARLADLREAGP
jgi:hypothetical protein